MLELNLTLNEFSEKLAEFNVIPLSTRVILDMETPVSIYIKSGAFQDPYTFMLESVTGGSNRGQYSILGLRNFAKVSGKNSEFKIDFLNNGQSKKLKAQKPLEALQEAMLQFRCYNDGRAGGFSSGAVGFFAYDCVRYYENITGKKTQNLAEQLKTHLPDPLNLEDMIYVLPQLVIVFDHASGSINLIYNVFAETVDSFKPEQIYKQVIDEIQKVVNQIKNSEFTKAYQNLPRPVEKLDFSQESNWNCNTSPAEFLAMVEASKEYIKAGDIFQVVPSKRFSREYPYHPFFLYRALRVTNPSPYMFYLNFPEVTLAGSSPEILVKKTGDEVFVRPIAGTTKRGKNPQEDAVLGAELLKDPKEIAEHIMLVDLGRNDVGRIADYGSVKVVDFKVLEKYSHVIHIVSNVTGKLRKGLTAFDVLQAGFPVGTVSGAPKVRAMEIIEELEKEKRGIYAGCIGYFSFDGDLDSCIALRTMVIKKGKLYIQAGGGVVYDSVAVNENEEAYRKSQASFRAVQLVYDREFD